MIKVSVIIAAYNEEKTIIDVLKKIEAVNVKGVEFSPIVVNDGSTDNTLQILLENKHLYAKLVNLEKNSGKGAAVIAGLGAADGSYILFQDADLEYDPVFYSNLIEPVLSSDADLVMGTRLMGGYTTRVHYFWHKVGNRFITLAFNLLNNTTFTDIYSCYLLYKKTLLVETSLKTTGWEQQAEILTRIIRSKKSKRWYETPISYHGRSYDEGKKIRARHAISVLWSIVRFRLTT